MIVAGTGHRPLKLGGYSRSLFERLVVVAEEALEPNLHHGLVVISGMALGWDQALAQAALNLKLPLVAAVPFKGQELAWPQASQEAYHKLLDQASSVVYVSDPGYAPWKMQRRNEWMVDQAGVVLAMWNGSAGGTANCIRYAEAQGVPVVNLWSRWQEGGVY